VRANATGRKPFQPLNTFPDLLRQATQQISDLYFQLPVAGQEDPIYRERVYCYELYHQLRTLWPLDSGYFLCGEIDKAGHPLIRGRGLDNTKPDLLVHIPGEGENAVALEVKPINALAAGVEKDLKTLTAYRRVGLYRSAVFLVYGSSECDYERIGRIAVECAANDGGRDIALELIELWWHQAPATPAGARPWLSDE